MTLHLAPPSKRWNLFPTLKSPDLVTCFGCDVSVPNLWLKRLCTHPFSLLDFCLWEQAWASLLENKTPHRVDGPKVPDMGESPGDLQSQPRGLLLTKDAGDSPIKMRKRIASDSTWPAESWTMKVALVLSQWVFGWLVNATIFNWYNWKSLRNLDGEIFMYCDPLINRSNLLPHLILLFLCCFTLNH